MTRATDPVSVASGDAAPRVASPPRGASARYRSAPSMGLRPAPQIAPRSMVRDTPDSLGVQGCASMVAALLVFAALVATVFAAMALA